MAGSSSNNMSHTSSSPYPTGSLSVFDSEITGIEYSSSTVVPLLDRLQISTERS